MPNVVPISGGTTLSSISMMERSQLCDVFKRHRQQQNEYIRRLVIDHGRIDVLATEVLGYEVMPFHLAMLKYQFVNPVNLQLVFRGAGKSTLCTVARAIFMLIRNPNLRILLASKTTSNAMGFLKEIKSHFEENSRLKEIFGVFYDPGRVSKWDDKEIEIAQRTKFTKESSITCVGVDSTIVSKHYDVIISDDLVDEENSRTVHMRDKTRTWYYKTLDPCLEPPSPGDLHRGEHHHLGTRYHYDDLYGHLIKKEMADCHQIIEPYDKAGNTVWYKYPLAWFIEKLKKAGSIIFNSQYLNDVEAMKGEIFEYDDCQRISEDELPVRADMAIFMGVDLAIKEKEKNDKFGVVVIGRHKENIYVLDHFSDRVRVGQQTNKIIEFWRKWKPDLIGIETNAYQEAQKQLVEDKDKKNEIALLGIHTSKDKVTRAWKIAPLFENKQVFFLESQTPVIDQIVGFPNHKLKDLFDAFDFAVLASKKKRRRARKKRKPFGVI